MLEIGKKAFFVILVLAAGCSGISTVSRTDPDPLVSISLVADSSAFDMEEVRHGNVGFTASIRNGGTETINIAHPSICLPRHFRHGQTRRSDDSHGKSEILLEISKPDGSNIILRDGYFHCFDPGDVPVLAIPPKGTGIFHVGWFFLNARGRWQRDDEAARAFLSRGKYRVRILFRNAFPVAVFYDVKRRENRTVGVWTGEMESPEVTVEVK